MSGGVRTQGLQLGSSGTSKDKYFVTNQTTGDVEIYQGDLSAPGTLVGVIKDDGTLSFKNSFKQGTPVSTASGVNKDFSIPSGVKKIYLAPQGVSTTGAIGLFLRLGDSTILTTGYVGGASMGATNVFNAGGFVILAGNDANTVASGLITLVNTFGNVWHVASQMGQAGNYTTVCTGHIVLSSELRTLRVVSSDGVTPFDLGSINIAYEG